MSLLQPYFKKGQTFLGVEIPIICGAMSSLSERNLVSAVANAGGFGVLAGGSLTADALNREINATCDMTDRPFGVNLIVQGRHFIDQFEVALNAPTEILVFAASIPDGKMIKTAKDAGKKVMCFAPSLAVANILIDQGADALIIEGSEAGGHIGPNTTLTLIQEVLLQVDTTPIFVAGGIATGAVMVMCFLLGAAGVQIGTRFAASKESIAHQSFKKALLKARTHSTVPFTPMLSSTPGHAIRCIKNAAYKEFTACIDDLRQKIKEDNWSSYQVESAIEEFWSGRLRTAVIDGDTKSGVLMSGESVGFVKKVESVTDILDMFVSEGEMFLKQTNKPTFP
jgi:enoyl-[acyl-carrier protein] reductase II